MAERQRYYMFVDECGDSFLDKVSEDFPILTLCGIIVTESQLESLETKVADLKNHFWGNIEVILHSRDIRKQMNKFSILFDPFVRQNFYCQLNKILGEEGAFTIVSCSILKLPFIEKNGKDCDIYGIALSRLIERCIFYLDEAENNYGSDLNIIIEMRGKKEDKTLSAYYEDFKTRGTKWLTPNRLNSHLTKFSFRSKKSNLTGLQIADLIAYPIARHVLNPEADNQSFEVLKCNIFTDKEKMLGLKVIPKGV